MRKKQWIIADCEPASGTVRILFQTERASRVSLVMRTRKQIGDCGQGVYCPLSWIFESLRALRMARSGVNLAGTGSVCLGAEEQFRFQVGGVRKPSRSRWKPQQQERSWPFFRESLAIQMNGPVASYVTYMGSIFSCVVVRLPKNDVEEEKAARSPACLPSCRTPSRKKRPKKSGKRRRKKPGEGDLGSGINPTNSPESS